MICNEAMLMLECACFPAGSEVDVIVIAEIQKYWNRGYRMRYCANPGKETAANSSSKKEQKDLVCKKGKTQEERPVSS